MQGRAASRSSSAGGCWHSSRLPLPAFVTGIVILVVLLATWSFEVTNTVIPQHGLATFDFSEYLSGSLTSPLNSPRYSYETKPDSVVQQQQQQQQQVQVQQHEHHHGNDQQHHSSSGQHHNHHHHHKRNLTRHWSGVLSLVIFVAAYVLVICEDRLQPYFRKSVPMTVAAGLIWAIVALQLGGGNGYVASIARHNLLEFGEVFLFLLVAMTYIATLEELNMFNVLRAYLVDRQFSYAMMFWITGALAFVLSPLADNLTTALLMGAVLTNIGRDQEQVCRLRLPLPLDSPLPRLLLLRLMLLPLLLLLLPTLPSAPVPPFLLNIIVTTTTTIIIIVIIIITTIIIIIVIVIAIIIIIIAVIVIIITIIILLLLFLFLLLLLLLLLLL